MFPHSDIPGSQLICSSPRLFAACHVLHRLLMPRHSPCALISLTFVGINSAAVRFILSDKAHSLRYASSPFQSLRFEMGYYRCPIIIGSLELCRFNRSCLQNCIYPYLEKLKFHNLLLKVLSFQITPSVALLFFFSSVQFSRCMFPT